MGGILIIKWAAKRAIGCRNVFAYCHKIALSSLLAVPGFLRTHPHTCQNSSGSAHLIPKFTEWSYENGIFRASRESESVFHKKRPESIHFSKKEKGK
jgi:hypothetical protein